jgi:hypothetical protein
MSDIGRDTRPNREGQLGTEYLRQETVAALTAQLFAGKKPLISRVSGYQGDIHLLGGIIDAANEFETESVLRAVIWDVTHDWIQCVEKLAEMFTYGECTMDDVFEAGKFRQGE